MEKFINSTLTFVMAIIPLGVAAQEAPSGDPFEGRGDSRDFFSGEEFATKSREQGASMDELIGRKLTPEERKIYEAWYAEASGSVEKAAQIFKERRESKERKKVSVVPDLDLPPTESAR